MFLGDHVGSIQLIIEKSLKSLLVRRNLIFHLIKAINAGSGVLLETCTFKYSRISFLFGCLHTGANQYLVRITIPEQYPEVCPKIAVVSATTHKTGPKPVIEKFNAGRYPYSPRWKPDELAQRIFKWLVETAADTKKGFAANGVSMMGP